MFLQEQTAEWDWNPSTNAAFQCLKAWICQTLLNTTLAYYDWSKPVIVKTDASEYGLSVALIQCGRPIAFASRTFTDVETCYANIERECLSVCFGLDKFHTYLYGRHVVIETDHNPLEMIHHKPHTCCTPLDLSACFSTCRSTIIPSTTSLAMNLADHCSQLPSAKEALPIPIHQNIQHI